MIKIPYGSYVELDGGRPARIGVVPHPEPDDALCLALLHAAGAPERVIRHCAAVAGKASELAAALGMDARRVRAAAYLHDIARAHPRHPEAGAGWLAELGYGELAELVRPHHSTTARRSTKRVCTWRTSSSSRTGRARSQSALRPAR